MTEGADGRQGGGCYQGTACRMSPSTKRANAKSETGSVKFGSASASSRAAAALAGRNSIGFEIDPAFADMALRRIRSLTMQWRLPTGAAATC